MTTMMTLKGLLAKGLLYFTALLPLPLNRALGALFGRLHFRLNTQMKKVTQENLRLCLPQLEADARRELGRQSLIETGRTLTETGAVWLKPYAWLQRHIVAVNGGEAFREAVGAGRGVVLLAPHLGNWEVLGLHMSDFGPVTSLYQPPELGLLQDLIRRGRERRGATLVPTDRSGVSALLKALRRGEIVGILPDQVPDRGSGGEFADFFGVPALTMTLANNLIKRTGCAVIAAYARRVPGGFELNYLRAHADIYSDNDQTALQGLNLSVEACVRGALSQYQWEYKRFKRQPEGKSQHYKFSH